MQNVWVLCRYESIDNLCSFHTKNKARIAKQKGDKMGTRSGEDEGIPLKFNFNRLMKNVVKLGLFKKGHIEIESLRGCFPGLKTHCFGKRLKGNKKQC